MKVKVSRCVDPTEYAKAIAPLGLMKDLLILVFHSRTNGMFELSVPVSMLGIDVIFE